MQDGFLGRLKPLHRIMLALPAGAFGALGQAPYDYPIALVVALMAGFALWRSEDRCPGLVGWAFGVGYFAATLHWIVEPFQVDQARHGWMAPFALLLMAAGLALFWGGAFWGARRLSGSALALVLTWSGAEIARAYLLTGFPWAAPAQVVVNGPGSLFLAWGGPHFVSLLLLASACFLSLPARWGTSNRRVLAQFAVLMMVFFALIGPDLRRPAETTDYWVRLIQPNAEQHLKWRPEMVDFFFERQIDLTRATPVEAGQVPDLVVWPETAIPWLLEDAEPALYRIAQAAGNTPVALGVLRFEGGYLRNALAVLGASGQVEAVYDKHHLVPFGEYIPFPGLFEGAGLQALAAAMGRFTPGRGPEVLDLGPLGRGMPLICYEAVFPHLVNAAPQRPEFLLQITNDAWFGEAAGPQQHLAQARMRAIEQGVPMVRAANTGISAMIDPAGRVIAALPLGIEGFLDAPLPSPLSEPLYARTGDGPVATLLLLALAGMALRNGNRISS